MLQRVFFSFCIVFSCTWLHSQTIEFGSPQKNRSKTAYTQILGENASGVFVIRCRNSNFSRDVVIEKYKSSLNLELSKELQLSIPSFFVERVMLIGENIYVFASAKNNSTGKIDILAQKLDMSLNPVGTLAVVASINENVLPDNKNFYIKTSADKNRIGLMFITYGSSKNNAALNIYTYSQNLEQLYGKRFEIEHNTEDIFITAYDIDNKGNTFLLVDYPRDLKRRRDYDPRIFYLYSYYNGADKMLEYEIGGNEKFIEELSMCVNNHLNVVSVAGFYSKEEKKAVDSYFYVMLDIESEELKNATYDSIPDRVWKKKNSLFDSKSDFNDMYIRKMVPRSDGGCLLVTERFFVTRQTYTYYINGFPQTGNRSIYNYNDVMFLSINRDGSIQFSENIRKEQQSVSDGGYYSSVLTMTMPDYVYIIYNADVSQEGDIMLNSIKYDGKSDNKIIVKSINKGANVVPGEARQTSANSIIATASREKRFALMRITF